MATTSYKTGWAKTPEGELFAPITTTNQVLTTDGQDLSMVLTQLQKNIDGKNMKTETNGQNKAYLTGVKSSAPESSINSLAFNVNNYIDEKGRLCVSAIRIGDAVLSWDETNQRLAVQYINNIGG